jgi:hypothetical protein
MPYALNDHVSWGGCSPKFCIGYIRGLSPCGVYVLVGGWRNKVPIADLRLAPEPCKNPQRPYVVNEWPNNA